MALLLLAGCGGGDPDAQFNGRKLDKPYDVPDVALTATDGASYSLAGDRDKPLTLVFFGYTHCPDLCPMVLSSLSAGLTKLDDADRERVEVVVVTTDPERDTEQVLRDYLDRFDPTWEGLTGELDAIIDAGRPARDLRQRRQEAALAAATTSGVTARPWSASTRPTRLRSTGTRTPRPRSSPPTSTRC